jgi:D-alanine-D-alanine ligase-like ATP-grasp enzyme
VSDRPVVVVGTTPDYIERILGVCPGGVVFLTDQRVRAESGEPAPPAELTADLRDEPGALRALEAWLAERGIVPGGVAGFDCESLPLTALVAHRLGLPYCPHEAVVICRSKFQSKRAWAAAGVPCPRTRLVRSAAQARAFMADVGGPVVLKPLTGSGSELTFVCRDRAQLESAYATMAERMAVHTDQRLYGPCAAGSESVDPRRVFGAEEFVAGDEYSCDLLVRDGAVQVVRLARKVPAAGHSFGTTLGYLVPSEMPPGLDEGVLHDGVAAAARALGVEHAVCMLDFIVRDGVPTMLEMTPRPGGDCLPALLEASCGLDVFRMTLEFAAGGRPRLPDRAAWRRLAGVRLLAGRAGVAARFNTSAFDADPRVVSYRVFRRPGHRVVMPPDDYSSRVLGHVIFEPGQGDPAAACAEMAARLQITYQEGP